MEEKKARGASEWAEEADAFSVAYLTSAEEYPDDEYLDMSKSSSLKQTKAQVSSLFGYLWWFKWQEVYACVCLCSPVCV